MTCGGVVKFLFEIFKFNQWNIAVFGAGHVAQELVPMLVRLDCTVTVCDAREEWLSRMAPADNLVKKLLPEPKSLVAELPANTYFILMSQGHATDLPVLTEILRLAHDAPYVGVIGSITKAMRLRSDLKALDFSEGKINSFFCPIGLDIGNNTPVEISHSVVAQLLQVKKQHEHKQ
jgi:xanthine dehydrogenase accessory factor